MKIAKVDTEERGGGGDGLAKDIHHKGEGQEVISAGFSFTPPPPAPLPGPFGTAATRVRRYENGVSCFKARSRGNCCFRSLLCRSYYLVTLTMQNTQPPKSYEGDIKQLPSGRNNHYFLGDFCSQTIETSKR